MDQARHKRNYDLHSWSGIVLGLFVFIVAFTGCAALFGHELHTWEDPARRLPLAENPAPIDATFTSWVAEQAGPDAEIEFARLSYPTPIEPYYTGAIEYELHTEDGGHEHIFVEQRWETQTGAPIADRGHGLSHWLVDFHRELMWPASLGGTTVGRGVVGIAGVILLLSIISGVVAHTKILQELFTLRFFRSMRLKWQDTHKVLGLWGLPFYTMIGLTGAVIGVVTLLAPAIALLTFKGDTEALFDAVLGTPEERAGVAAQMMSVDDFQDRTHPESGNPLRYLIVTNWGDETATYDLYFDADTELAQIEGYRVDAVTGERIDGGAMENVTPANRVLNAMTPLHYGTYGGIALKFLYLALGLSLAIITALGLMMWVERRLHGNEGRRSPLVYKAISKLTVGVTCGLPLASAAIFYADRLIPVAPDGRIAMIGWSYFTVWGAGLIYAFLRGNDYRATKDLLLATGGLLAAIPVLNTATTGDLFVTGLFSNHIAAAGVDLTMLVMGALTIAGVLMLPKGRTGKAVRRVVTVEDDQGLAVARSRGGGGRPDAQTAAPPSSRRGGCYSVCCDAHFRDERDLPFPADGSIRAGNHLSAPVRDGPVRPPLHLLHGRADDVPAARGASHD
ncbi:Aspartate kinase [Parvularcula bermudensis HTCC2503]|uniref:Aspartate kinase n=1 Tax=Parvularcula bermudensis (strain ATCC BAA-594 / HTCC2503 / KCTC 12087) TaxID=314260 RepID=E0THH6_PARBH|nr:PepSY-associated TM helix domain-containing protein [Parvularcula bermudensis]ADM10768.1 Aspartate kinase [Parvularcula bermudensis HTCC2503]